MGFAFVYAICKNRFKSVLGLLGLLGLFGQYTPKNIHGALHIFYPSAFLICSSNSSVCCALFISKVLLFVMLLFQISFSVSVTQLYLGRPTLLLLCVHGLIPSLNVTCLKMLSFSIFAVLINLFFLLLLYACLKGVMGLFAPSPPALSFAFQKISSFSSFSLVFPVFP